MASNDSQNLQILSVSLVILSLALLYCWYNKPGNDDGMKGSYFNNSPLSGGFRDHFHPRLKHGMSGGPNKYVKSIPHLSAELPELHFVDGMATSSIHDVATSLNHTLFKHNPTDKQKKLMDRVTPKWNVDAMVNDPSSADPGAYSPDDMTQNIVRWGSVKVPKEIITPGRPTSMGSNTNCPSPSETILTMSDYAPQYGPSPYSSQITIA